MISIDEATEIIRNNLPQPTTEDVSLALALDRVLSDEIIAPEHSPRFTNSAMDGFAVRWVDVKESHPNRPVSLTIVGESRAGIPFGERIGPNQTTHISTGSVLPDGADTVIRVEDTEVNSTGVKIFQATEQGQHVRRVGEEFEKGTRLLWAGHRLDPPRIALLASLGVDKVKVYAMPSVSLIVTGSELVGGACEIQSHQIRDSNSPMLQAAVVDTGGSICAIERIPDNLEATIDAIQSAEASITLCSGGVSVGRHDHVKKATEACGFQTLFWRISQKPGKPLFCARKDDRLLFGLPGNPVSAFMCFAHYVRPVINSLRGLSFGWRTVSAEVGQNITNNGRRTLLVRMTLEERKDEGYLIREVERQGSHMLTSLVNADGYVILHAGDTLRRGSRTDVYLIHKE